MFFSFGSLDDPYWDQWYRWRMKDMAKSQKIRHIVLPSCTNWHGGCQKLAMAYRVIVDNTDCECLHGKWWQTPTQHHTHNLQQVFCLKDVRRGGVAVRSPIIKKFIISKVAERIDFVTSITYFLIIIID
jgi:hypothetical protein